MRRTVIKVVVTDRDDYGDAFCKYCDKRVIRRVPYNYPQVCRECADIYVWRFGGAGRSERLEREG